MKTERKVHRLVVGDERGLIFTLFFAGVVVAAFAIALKLSLEENSWFSDFFFKRRFVQWALLMAFAVGIIHLLRRVPLWLKERKALITFSKGETLVSNETIVGRRCLQIQAAMEQAKSRSLSQYAKHIAEQDEAELDAAYRLSGDVVQVLPLLGFFGTVFGLSIGLYGSFLANGGGGIKPQEFAKAIAIAFDNTLLGLALTIILFITQSLLRKREDAILNHLNLLVNDTVVEQELSQDTLGVTLTKNVALITDRLDKAAAQLDGTAKECKEAVKTYTTEVATSVVSKMAEQQKAEFDSVFQSVANHLKEQSSKLSEVVLQNTSALTKLDEPIRAELGQFKAAIEGWSKTLQEMALGISTLSKRDDNLPELQRITTSIVELINTTKHYQSDLVEHLKAIEAIKNPLENISSNTQGLREEVNNLNLKMALLSPSLADHHQLLIEKVKVIVETQSGEIKSQTEKIINQPRKFTLVEAPQQTGRDGEARSQ